MVNQKMLKYLEQCKDLELSIYTQTQEVKKLNRYISTLGKENRIEKPQEYIPSIDSENKIMFLFLIIGSAFLFWLLFIVGGFHILGTIVGLIPCIFFTIIYIGYYKEIEGSKEYYKHEYSQKMTEYKKAQDADIERLKREQKQIPILEARVSTIKKQISDTKISLNKLYALNIINEDYRGLIPVAMFCEYFRKELCYKLEGPNGAYRLYENDLKWGKMYAKIDEVLSKLDEIRETQEALYLEIERSNRLSNRLYNTAIETSKTMRNIEANSVISAENSRITAQNARAIANMELYRFLRE